MGAHGQRQDLEPFLETPFMLQEIRVCHEAQTQAGERLALERNGVGDAVEVGGFGRIRGQIPQVTPHRVELPEQTFTPARAIRAQYAIGEPRDQVRAQRQARGQIAVALVLIPRSLQEGSMRQYVGGRLDLTEQLLRCEQIASFP